MNAAREQLLQSINAYFDDAINQYQSMEVTSQPADNSLDDLIEQIQLQVNELELLQANLESSKFEASMKQILKYDIYGIQ